MVSHGIFPINTILLYFVKFTLAFLNRRPNTQTLRACILPIAVLLCLRTQLDYAPQGSRHPLFNWGIGFTSLSLLAHSFDLAFTTTGMNRLNGGSETQKSSTPNNLPKKTFFETLSEAHELVSAYRGIGLECGKTVPLPLENRPLERGPFLRASFFMFLRSFIGFDILAFFLELTPPFHNGGGGLYLKSLPIPQRILLAMFMHIGTAFFVIGLFNSCHLLATLIAVGIFNSPPSAWPSLFNEPWRADSIQDFWGRRWHQILRRPFSVMFGFPCQWLGRHIGLGRAGMLFGVFLASALYHELPCYMEDGEFHWKPLLFFLSQAFIICLERWWKNVTGKKVSGWWGRIWAYFCLLTLGQLAVDSWLLRGLGSGMAMIHHYSPSRYLFQPLIDAPTILEPTEVQTTKSMYGRPYNTKT